jgi:uncharacterized damage-inducible protein DinB
MPEAQPIDVPAATRDYAALIDAFERGGERLSAATAGLSGEQRQARPVPGTWSIHEIVVHMADSDAIGIDRMKRIIAEDLPLLIGYNETRFIQRLFPHEQPLGQVVALFDQARRLFAITLRKLTPADFERGGIHNEVGKKTLAAMLESYVDHLDHHLRFIKQKKAMLLASAGAAAPTPDSDATLIATYETCVADVRRAIAGMSAEQLLARPVPGRWSTQEVVIHLADADLAFAHRLKRIIAEERPTYDAWSENRFAATLAYHEQSAEDAVAIMEATHRQLSRLFQTLEPGWLDRKGVHVERGEQTARVVLEYATWHVSHHLKFVAEKRAKLGM